MLSRGDPILLDVIFASKFIFNNNVETVIAKQLVSQLWYRGIRCIASLLSKDVQVNPASIDHLIFLPF